MDPFVIYTDSACDLDPSLLAEWGVGCQSLTFRFEGEDKEYENGDMNAPTFYQRMREGGVAKTAAINAELFAGAFSRALENGSDVLYIGFSSGLSTTFNSARLAAKQLAEKYPERKVVVVDTLGASAGEGLILYHVVKKKNEGATLEETAAYAESLRLHTAHWFTVDDLVYLKRGGRVSATSAFVGNMLGIKPVLHMDNEGHLVPVAKVRGRKTSVVAMADKYSETALDPENGVVFISHGDCMADVELLKSLLRERHGAGVEMIVPVGPVIGAHSGPGTLALFFLAKER